MDGKVAAAIWRDTTGLYMIRIICVRSGRLIDVTYIV